MTQSRPPFRADHVGRLPPAVTAARKSFADGEITPEELKSVEDKEIPGLISIQEEAGLKAVVGDFPTGSYISHGRLLIIGTRFMRS